MNLFIPELGTRLLLSEPWTASLSYERRNLKALEKHCPEAAARHKALFTALRSDLGGLDPTRHRSWGPHRLREFALLQQYNDKVAQDPLLLTIPAGQILVVDRIYVRSGAEDFSSVTFKWKPGRITERFWVPLEQANQIKFSSYSYTP